MMKHLLFNLIAALTIFLFTPEFLQAQESDSPKSLVRPDYLKPGDTIAIIAPAGILRNQEPIEAAMEMAKSWGLHVKTGKHLFDQHHQFSGTDADRLADIQQAFDDPSVKAVWCGRGGYGTGRIIDDIDFTGFLKHPKWLIGYSDITVLHNHIHNLGVETIHGMMGIAFKELNEDREISLASLKKVIFGEEVSYSLPSSPMNRRGTARGQLVGGNLSLLQNMLGTPSTIDTNGKILFIEEIGEYMYHIDRMLYGLKRNGYFENCAGLIIGDFSNIKKNTTPFGQTLQEVVLAITADYDFPVLFDFPSGHEDKNLALIFGREVKLRVGKSNATVRFK